MANPIVTIIDRAGKDVWPQVTEGIAKTHRTMLEVAEISEQAVPKVEEYVARGNGAPIRRRKICEETIWVLASLGWLRTGGERDVILAAKAWLDLDPDATIDVVDEVDDTLAEAIKSLPEYLTTPKES